MARRTPLTRRVSQAVTEGRERIALLARALGLLWSLEVVDVLFFRGGLDSLGVRPRTVPGLGGVLLAPFLHGSFGHLLANSVPFAVLGMLVMARKRMDFWVVSVGTALTAGLGTWLVGAPGTVHVGASGVVFGYLGFLMGRGVHERSLSTLLLSLTVTFFFGGMLWGVLPTVGPGISWEGHLFGWLGGVGISRLLGDQIRGRSGR